MQQKQNRSPRRSDAIQVSVTPRERRAVEAIARREGRTLSDVGRDAILALIQERSNGAPS